MIEQKPLWAPHRRRPLTPLAGGSQLPLALLCAALLLIGACGGETGSGGPASREARVTAFVGLGLKEAFSEAGAAFERAHPGTRLAFTFQHVPELLAALDQGASADLIVTHDDESMQRVVKTGRTAGAPRVVARNHLAIVVPAGNPKQVAGLTDLDRPGMGVVLCRPNVPCGALAQRVLRGAGVSVSRPLVDGGPAVVTKVATAEADAGLAFVTDIRAGGAKVAAVPLPPEHSATSGIPAVALEGTRHPTEAAAFLDFVQSGAGAAIFERHGFLPG